MANLSKRDLTYGLAFETSSAQGSIALGRGDTIIETRELSGPRRHAVEFLPILDALCKAHRVEPADVGVVYVSTGPGSFTGLRIGISVARMIAFASRAFRERGEQHEPQAVLHPGAPPDLSPGTPTDSDAQQCRLVAVPTLEVIAQNVLELPVPPDRAVVILDAKRGRVYACGFVREHGRYVPLGAAVEADPGVFLAQYAYLGGSCAVLGEGVAYHRAAVESSGLLILRDDLHPPRVETVYRLGAERGARGMFTAPRALIPTYIRPPEAEEKWQMIRG